MGAEYSYPSSDYSNDQRQKTIKNFDPNKYSGKWFELARYDTLKIGRAHV